MKQDIQIEKPHQYSQIDSDVNLSQQEPPTISIADSLIFPQRMNFVIVEKQTEAQKHQSLIEFKRILARKIITKIRR